MRDNSPQVCTEAREDPMVHMGEPPYCGVRQALQRTAAHHKTGVCLVSAGARHHHSQLRYSEHSQSPMQMRTRSFPKPAYRLDKTGIAEQQEGGYGEERQHSCVSQQVPHCMNATRQPMIPPSSSVGQSPVVHAVNTHDLQTVQRVRHDVYNASAGKSNAANPSTGTATSPWY